MSKKADKKTSADVRAYCYVCRQDQIQHKEGSFLLCPVCDTARNLTEESNN